MITINKTNYVYALLVDIQDEGVCCTSMGIISIHDNKESCINDIIFCEKSNKLSGYYQIEKINILNCNIESMLDSFLKRLHCEYCSNDLDKTCENNHNIEFFHQAKIEKLLNDAVNKS